MDISTLAATAIGLILPHLKDVVGSAAENLTSQVKEALKEKIKALFKKNENVHLDTKLKETEQAPTEQNIKDLHATLQATLEQTPSFKEELEGIFEKLTKQGDSYTQQVNINGPSGNNAIVNTVNGDFNFNTQR